MSVSLLGVPELKAEIDRLTKDMAIAEDASALAAAEPVKDAWVGFVPVFEGHYRDSLVVVWLDDKGAAAVGTRYLPGVPRDEQPFIYSKRLEFGDSDIGAQPSARPAAKAAKAEALAAGAPPLQAVIKGRRPRKRLPVVP